MDDSQAPAPDATQSEGDDEDDKRVKLREKYLKCAEECMQKAREAAVAGGVFVATKYARNVHNIDISNNPGKQAFSGQKIK